MLQLNLFPTRIRAPVASSSGLILSRPHTPPFPVTHVRCDVDEAPLFCWQGVLTYSAGPGATEWDLAQDDKGERR